MTCVLNGEIRAFLQEKLYLQNVSPRTIILYESCFKAFDGATENLELAKGEFCSFEAEASVP